jgi:hypothetical protein
VGAVVGVIFFIIRRTLVGEVADPCATMRELADARAPAMAESPTSGQMR